MGQTTDTTSSTKFLDACAPEIKQIFEYWDSKRRGRRMPSREDIDPIEIPRLLPKVQLVDVEQDPLRFRYRLVGTEMVARRGSDPTGKEVGKAFYGSDPQRIIANYTYVVEHKTHQYSNTQFKEPRGWYVSLERIYLPLSEDDDLVNKILVLVIWSDRIYRTGGSE
ncbi:MAG: PAS domain-containing protein [Alphaproteobacteria bacterium]|jgi:hypothetical protein|nr:PAS domain-containing protein [Alphaproteobacteria bacterium]